MNLMLLSRALSYCGISTLGAVDASLGREVRDITGLIRLVDLLGGMQVLTGRGNVTILREYCTRSEAGASVNRVLDSLEELTETVTLCRTTEIPMRMMAFTEALKAADQMQDPLLQKLLSVFHTRFQIPGWRMEDHLTSPGLIQWYLNIGQIQEAMTVYTELIPSYLINVVGVIQVSQDMIWEVPLDYEDIYTVQFRQNFIRLSDSRNPTKLFRRWIEEHYEEICAVVRKEKPLEFLTPPAPLAAGVDNLVRVSRLAYPSNGPFDPCWAGRLPRRKGFLGELTNRLSKQPPKTSDALLKKAAQFPKQDMLVLMEHDPAGFRLPPEAMTIELLEELLPGSGYQVACPGSAGIISISGSCGAWRPTPAGP